VRALVVGAGAVGARAARQLASTPDVEVLVHDVDPHRVDVVVEALGGPARPARGDEDVDVAVLAHPAGDHADRAVALAARGIASVSTSSALVDVRALLAAAAVEVPVVAGAAFAPGLSCLLAAHAVRSLDDVDEVHVARVGAGGPACELERREAAAGRGEDWRAGSWTPARGGRTIWFAPPVDARTCHPAATADALLLHRAFPGASAVSGRLASSLTDRLPRLRPPTGELGIGGLRVEVRGHRAGAQVNVVYGAVDRPAVAAGAVAAEAALAATSGRIAPGPHGLAELDDPLAVLQALAARGVKAAVLEPR
jgi:hypothetical protein